MLAETNPAPGSGWAIVTLVVTRHRGELRTASRRGEGSTFNIVLVPAIPKA